MKQSTAPSTDPSTQRRLLSQYLSQARLDAGYTQPQASAEVHWSKHKLLRVENGQVGLSVTDLRALLDLYQVHDPQQRGRLETMAEQGRLQPRAAHHYVLSPLERRYLGWEGSASRLRQYEPFLVPELLRTQAYARAVAEALAPPGTSKLVLRRQWEACLARQQILDRDDPPELSFVIDEAALHRPVGARTASTIMAKQAKRLDELADRDTVTVHVLPMSAGPYRGLGTAFVVLDFTDGDASRVYLPGRTRPVLTAPREVARYDQLYTDLTAAATPAHLLHKILDQTLLHAADSDAESPHR